VIPPTAPAARARRRPRAPARNHLGRISGTVPAGDLPRAPSMARRRRKRRRPLPDLAGC